MSRVSLRSGSVGHVQKTGPRSPSPVCCLRCRLQGSGSTGVSPGWGCTAGRAPSGHILGMRRLQSSSPALTLTSDCRRHHYPSFSPGSPRSARRLLTTRTAPMGWIPVCLGIEGSQARARAIHLSVAAGRIGHVASPRRVERLDEVRHRGSGVSGVHHRSRSRAWRPSCHPTRQERHADAAVPARSGHPRPWRSCTSVFR